MSDPKYEHVGSRLDHLTEECAEVIKQICKVRRFGIETAWGGRRNVNRLVDELTDLKQRIKEVEIWIDETTPDERRKLYP